MITIPLGRGNRVVAADRSVLRLLAILRIRREVRDSVVTVGRDFRAPLSSRLVLSGRPSAVEIGEGVLWRGRATVHTHDRAARLVIGDGVRMHGVYLACRSARLEIGAGTILSHGVEIRTSDAHRLFDADGTRLNPEADVIVGQHCWIGARAMLLQGTQLAADCVVGAMSLVKGPVAEPGTVVAGVPARPVRHGVRWER